MIRTNTIRSAKGPQQAGGSACLSGSARQRDLEEENARLKRLVANQALNIEMLKDELRKNQAGLLLGVKRPSS